MFLNLIQKKQIAEAKANMMVSKQKVALALAFEAGAAWKDNGVGDINNTSARKGINKAFNDWFDKDKQNYEK